MPLNFESRHPARGPDLSELVRDSRKIVQESVAHAVSGICTAVLNPEVLTPKVLHYRCSAAGETAQLLLPVLKEAFVRMAHGAQQERRYEPLFFEVLDPAQLPEAATLIREGKVTGTNVSEWSSQAQAHARNICPTGYDLIFASNFLANPRMCKAMQELQQILSLLKPGGGLVYVQDAICAQETILPGTVSLADTTPDQREAILQEAKHSMSRRLRPLFASIKDLCSAANWGEIHGGNLIAPDTLSRRVVKITGRKELAGVHSAHFLFGLLALDEDILTPVNLAYAAFALFAKK
jgi:hypothetical protein